MELVPILLVGFFTGVIAGVVITLVWMAAGEADEQQDAMERALREIAQQDD